MFSVESGAHTQARLQVFTMTPAQAKFGTIFKNDVVIAIGIEFQVFYLVDIHDC
jgi:hypothetical protein